MPPYSPECRACKYGLGGQTNLCQATRENPGARRDARRGEPLPFGLGDIGLNVIQGARLSGADRMVGVDINPGRRAPAERLGMPTSGHPPGLKPAEDVHAPR